MIDSGILIAIITGFFAVFGQVIISKRMEKDLYHKLDKHQAVTDTKIEELTREVREHNNFAKRIPVMEEKIRNLETRMEDNK